MAAIPTLLISRKELVPPLDHGDACITRMQHLASYNWIEAKTPTIAVPGCPSTWRGATASRRLPRDSGHVYIAQNTARHPDSPLEPLFRALYIEQPEFDISSVDVVSDRNNIRKLLSFVDPKASKYGPEPFTMTVEAVDRTVLFGREEPKVEEYIGKNEFRGFGHEFEKAYTVNQIRGSTGHHRIISYHFNQLKMLIRHETDGSLDNEVAPNTSSKGDDVLDLLGKLTLDTATPTPTPGKGISDSKIIVKHIGRRTRVTSTIEIKTRAASRLLPLDEVAPQLWVSQTPNLVRAYHVNGVFGPASVENVAQAVVAWEKKNQKSLRALEQLLQKILVAARKHGRATIRFDVVADKLKITPTKTAANMLPPYLYTKWKESQSASRRSSVIKKSASEQDSSEQASGRDGSRENGSVSNERNGDKSSGPDNDEGRSSGYQSSD